MTLEDLGYIAARFYEVRRTPLGDKKKTPWVVALNDMESLAKYMPSASYFVDYLERRSALNFQAAMGAFDEMDWLGRYFYDALTFAEVKREMARVLADEPLATGSLSSHTTEVESFESYEGGTRRTPAPKQKPDVHPVVDAIVVALDAWGGKGRFYATGSLLRLPPKLQRSLGKRVAKAVKTIRPRRTTVEVAIAEDDSEFFACTICGEGVDASAVCEPVGGTARQCAACMSC